MRKKYEQIAEIAPAIKDRPRSRNYGQIRGDKVIKRRICEYILDNSEIEASKRNVVYHAVNDFPDRVIWEICDEYSEVVNRRTKLGKTKEYLRSVRSGFKNIKYSFENLTQCTKLRTLILSSTLKKTNYELYQHNNAENA